MRQALVYNADLTDHRGQHAAEARACLGLLPTKHDQIVIGLQNNIGDAVTSFNSRLRDELGTVMREIDITQFKIVAADS